MGTKLRTLYTLPLVAGSDCWTVEAFNEFNSSPIYNCQQSFSTRLLRSSY
jgi:hypothetical protein